MLILKDLFYVSNLPSNLTLGLFEAPLVFHVRIVRGAASFFFDATLELTCFACELISCCSS